MPLHGKKGSVIGIANEQSIAPKDARGLRNRSDELLERVHARSVESVSNVREVPSQQCVVLDRQHLIHGRQPSHSRLVVLFQ
jgi:enoyl-[acyl-carrier-protein] reductase (NADH)